MCRGFINSLACKPASRKDLAYISIGEEKCMSYLRPPVQPASIPVSMCLTLHVWMDRCMQCVSSSFSLHKPKEERGERVSPSLLASLSLSGNWIICIVIVKYVHTHWGALIYIFVIEEDAPPKMIPKEAFWPQMCNRRSWESGRGKKAKKQKGSPARHMPCHISQTSRFRVDVPMVLYGVCRL